MALTYYRGMEFVQDYTVKYLTAIYLANEKGQLSFSDGTRKVVFSKRPYVIKRGSWDYRDLPTVLVGEVEGKFREYYPNKSFLKENEYGDTLQQKEWGGDIHLTVNIGAVSTTKEEAYKLADITAIYLAHPDCKDFYSLQGITIASVPRLSSCRQFYEPAGLDHPIYEVPIAFDVIGVWREVQSQNDRLIKIIAEITAELDFDS